MKISAVLGNPMRLDGGAMFGHAPKELWKHWIEPDEKNQIPIACRTLVLQDFHGKTILFDVGTGAYLSPKLRDRYGVKGEAHELLDNLKKEGIQEESVDAVILSHLHFDHCGGLLPAYDSNRTELHFPNATYYTGKAQWERANDPHPREKASFIPELLEKLKESNRLKLIDHPTHPDLPDMTFHRSDGHTIGLLSTEILYDSKHLLVGSDLIAGVPWIHLPITMGYDRFTEKTVDEKRVLLEQNKEKQWTLFFVHDPFTAFSKVIQDEKGKFKPKFPES